MYSKQALSALAAISMVSGAIAVGCDDPTATIKSAADATQVANCDKIEGSVLIAKEAGPNIDLSGKLTEIGGDLSCADNKLIASIKSSSLETIGGVFSLKNLIALTSSSFPKLGEVGSIDFATLTKLGSLGLGTPGITKADSIIIGDTYLDSLEGINVENLQFMDLNNNRRLTTFSTAIETVSKQLLINANGLNLTMEMSELKWISNMTIGNVTRFSAPKLSTVNGSIRFDSNYFKTFALPNLTEIQEGDLAFVSNPQVGNISFPLLEKIGGGLTIANNTDLETIDGFPKLANIGGAIAFRGVFTSAELPALEDVSGGFELVSTANLTESTCSTFEDNKSTGIIQGDLIDCSGNDESANENTGGADGTGSGSGSGTEDEPSAAPLAGINTWAMVGLAALGAVFTTL